MGSVNDISADRMLPPPQAGGIDSSSAADMANHQGTAANMQAAGAAASQAANAANAMGAIPPSPTGTQVAGTGLGGLARGFYNASAPIAQAPMPQQVQPFQFVQSDEQSKTKIDDKPPIRQFLEAVKGYSWDYKDPKHGAGRYTGVMAQDLQKSEIGREVVSEGPDGLMVDTRRLTPVNTAALAYHEMRIKALEDAVQGQRGKRS